MSERTKFIIITSAGTILLLVLSMIIISFVVFYHRRRTKHLLAMAALKQTFDRELFNSQLEIQEQTFRMISQEIHDNIGQILTLAKLNLNLAGPQCSHIPLINETHSLVAKAISDLRDLSKGLSPDRVAEIDLMDSLRHELQMLEKTGIYTTDLKISGSPYALDGEKKIILFRIVQEALNNIIKHAQATNISIILDYSTDIITLVISDNGKGFIIDEQYNGIGIRNIKNRSSLIGAIAKLCSSPGQGTQVSVHLPI